MGYTLVDEAQNNSNTTLLDVSLIGTHDTLTYDLSTTISDGAEDISQVISSLLHDFGFGIGGFIRNQSRTHQMSITEQLNSGVRFLDIRVEFTAPPKEASFRKHDWYAIHFVESRQTAMEYLKEVRLWLDAHPTEVIVMWVSKHGSTCEPNQYPTASVKQQREFWASMQETFSGLLVNHTEMPVNETAVSSMVARNKRVVVYVSNWDKMTASSDFALDACTHLDNVVFASATSPKDGIIEDLGLMADWAAERGRKRLANQLFLKSFAGEPPREQILLAAEIKYYPLDHQSHREKCAQAFNITNMTDWCPSYLVEIGQLKNYYTQITMEKMLADPDTYQFPNAVYLDAVDVNGTIRTDERGTGYPPGSDPTIKLFSYGAAILRANAHRLCRLGDSYSCSLEQPLKELYDLHPVQLWDNIKRGRTTRWQDL